METTIKSLPAIAVRGIVPIPSNDFRIEVGRKISLDALEIAEKDFGQYVILLIQKNPLIDEPTKEDIYEYGVIAKISMKIKLPNGNFKVKFNVIDRVIVKEFLQEDPF